MSRDLGQTFTSISNNVNSTHEYLWYGYIYNLIPLFLVSLFSCLLLSSVSSLSLSFRGVMPYDTDPSTIYYNVDNPNDHTCESLSSACV